MLAPRGGGSILEISFTLETAVPAERILAAATDFTERRTRVWGSIDPDVFRVHATGQDWAEVTEGERTMGGIWARERYDWSTPGVVRAEVQDSNVFGPGSSWELRVTPRGGEGSTVEWITHRVGKGAKGRFLVMMMRVAGRRELQRRLRRTLEAIDQGGGRTG